MKQRQLHVLIVAALLVAPILQACGTETATATPITAAGTITPQAPPTGGTPSLGQRTKTSGCVSTNSLPDPACSPGAVFADATADMVCTPGYSTSVRDVPAQVKAQAYAEYGIASHEPGQYEVDHLIALELGGSNDIANLWPESADPRPGFHEKDQVENYLHDQVCSGKMSLQEAQFKIATDWLAVYHSMP
jgi:hypothetical protein